MNVKQKVKRFFSADYEIDAIEEQADHLSNILIDKYQIEDQSAILDLLLVNLINEREREIEHYTNYLARLVVDRDKLVANRDAICG